LTMVPQQVHLHGQWLGKRQHGCPPIWWLFVYLLHCIWVCFLLYEYEHFWAEEYFKYIPGRTVLSYMEICIYPRYSGEGRFLNSLSLFFPSQLRICIGTFRKGLACSVPASCQVLTGKLPPLLLLLKGELTLHVSLSEGALKLPPSKSESFKISLILSVLIKFLWSIFWTRTWSGIFHIACEARNIIWLVRPHW